ncbi:hypothetical protein [Rhodococcus sp. NBC_00294]|uniref:hypothetical protein n=1 Tax=Rhodococcus sp. NBC_00294 TaxID=2976004 RepID=UPI002E2910DD|nr:hypothetical protein [Rhodococcus sp. NBC_00294]
MATIALAGYPVATDFLKTDAAAGGANRGLVVIATSGGAPKTTLHAEQRYDESGDLAFVFYFTSPNVQYTDEAPTVRLDYTIAFVGGEFDGRVTCANGDIPAGTTFANLSAGTKNAISADVRGGDSSAQNFEGDGTQGSEVLSSLQQEPIFERSGVMRTLKDGSSYSDRSQDEDRIWAEECLIQKQVTKREVDAASQLTSSRFTVLPLQVNWVSKNNVTDIHSDIASRVTIDRSSEVQLRESYPPLSSLDNSWMYKTSGNWVKSLGQEGNFGYTNQPVYIFGDRALEDSKALFLTVLGLALGLFSALLVGVVSKLLDLTD